MPELSSSLSIHSLENSKGRQAHSSKLTINSSRNKMAKRIYVGNLSFQVTEADLSELFAQVGAVDSVKIITDRDTGRSKGFAFVEMSDDSAAEQAISKFNGTDFNGRNLTVNEARPMEKRDFGSRGSSGGRGRGGRDRY
jgi:cold-inducible RNA-binding protein